MLTWLNPRVIVTATSLLVLLQVSRHGTTPFDEHRAILACAAYFAAYVIAFLLPLWRSFGALRILVPLCALSAAWAAIAFALISDARPLFHDDGITQRWNWTMTAFCLAAGVALILFFENTARGFRMRREKRTGPHTLLLDEEA